MTPEQARKLVAAWRADDWLLPIPDSAWGDQFAEAIDILLEQNPKGAS